MVKSYFYIHRRMWMMMMGRNGRGLWAVGETIALLPPLVTLRATHPAAAFQTRPRRPQCQPRIPVARHRDERP